MRIWQAVVAYRAMLAAAPQPPAAEGAQAVEAEQRARELLEAECGRPLPLDVPVCAAHSAVVAALSQQPDQKAEAQLTYKGVPIGPMQTFADIERQATVPADPRAAAEQAIAGALRRERMAPDDYAPMPDSPVPMESDE